MTAFDRALRQCARWGVEVRSSVSFGSGWSEAPMNRAKLHYEDRVIEWADRRTDGTAAALLHELAHAIDPSPPDSTLEIDGPLLAVEFALDRAARVSRRGWIGNFAIGDAPPPGWASSGWPGCWTDATTHQRGYLLARSRKKAVACGLLTAGGKMTYRAAKGDARCRS